MLVKAGTVLTFQIHYTTTGKVASDKTSMGFIFAKQPPTIEMRTNAMLNPRFMIPAGADNHPVEAGVNSSRTSRSTASFRTRTCAARAGSTP